MRLPSHFEFETPALDPIREPLFKNLMQCNTNFNNEEYNFLKLYFISFF